MIYCVFVLGVSSFAAAAHSGVSAAAALSHGTRVVLFLDADKKAGTAALRQG
jgi:hypothetical protein